MQRITRRRIVAGVYVIKENNIHSIIDHDNHSWLLSAVNSGGQEEGLERCEPLFLNVFAQP